MQLLAFTVGLGLLFVAGAMMPPLTPARAEQILGKWHIRSWAGNMPIPSWKWSDPLPPFAFERNSLGDLEFRMNLTKPIGCIPFKLPLYEGEELGTFLTWWRHLIYIHFLPGKNFAIAYFRGKMNYRYYQIMMLMGRTLEADLDAVRIFKEFVETKIPKTGEIITPPHVEACELVQDS
ncbi:lipocalin-1 isoform X2 [Mesocricetus auratus]|uniref:Lipocalin-1 isoform X2 n=1 Tax=Mesocricetus auratus TaxID=10036 RepID=A0A3Q0DD48_MESAU|nr:lipocalin-1 isoform X2 [Mesocricetus auratus]